MKIEALTNQSREQESLEYDITKNAILAAEKQVQEKEARRTEEWRIDDNADQQNVGRLKREDFYAISNGASEVNNPVGQKQIQEISHKASQLTKAGFYTIGIFIALIIAIAILYSISQKIGSPSTAVPTNTKVIQQATLPSTITDAKNIQMMLVPVGEFTMGSDIDRFGTGIMPAHQVNLDDFYIDKYEVTNSLYKACVDTQVCIAPKFTRSPEHFNYYGNPEFDNFPVLYVDWYMAKTYCEWRGAQLPTEAQWEKAARGISVNIEPPSENPFGINGMSNGIGEWTNSLYQPYPYISTDGRENPSSPDQRVVRGMYDIVDREPNLPGANGDGKFGFRCSRNP